jgi:Domain of unknown function (DUF5034)
MHKIKTLLFFATLLIYGFQCGEPDSLVPNIFSTTNWNVSHLDNTGDLPQILENASSAPLIAYGIHLEADVLKEDSTTILNNENGIYANQAKNELKEVVIFTELPFLDTISAGSNVTNFFKIRLKRIGNSSSIVKYNDMNNAIFVLNYPEFVENNKLIADFLLINGPKSAGEVQFSVQLTFTDTAYLLPLSKILLE